MKNIRLMIFALLCAVAQWAWAQSLTVVTTEDQLRSAVEIDNANIKLGASISLTQIVSIENNRTITIDLNDFTLDRGCTSRGSQVLVVRTGSTLNLSGGTLTGGWGGNGGALDIEAGAAVNLSNVIVTGNHADDRGGGIGNHGTLTMTGGSITNNTSNDSTDPKGGGGIFNYTGATATLTNVTISGNEAKHYGGGGICNFGTLTLDGGTITDNTAGSQGGGIWQEGTLNIQGAVTITGNKHSNLADNVYLKNGSVINVTGSLEGSSIGITMENITGTFTNGYSTYSSGIAPSALFTADNDVFYDVTLSENEACISQGALIYPVTTEAQLRSAIEMDNANIKLGANISLTQIVGIENNRTITIDLNNYTLDRGCTARDGQAIVVQQGSMLRLSNGTVARGWGGAGGGIQNYGITDLVNVTLRDNVGDDRGGGICNYGTLTMLGGAIRDNTTRDNTSLYYHGFPTDPDYPGGGGIYNHDSGTVTLKDVTITGNKDTGFSGGGICNNGVMMIDGCTITGNKARKLGGGIWNNGTLNIKGANTITGNTASSGMVNNLYLTSGRVVNVTGSLAISSIGVSLHDVNGTFTSDYDSYNSGIDPATVFSADLSAIVTVSYNTDNEAQLESTLPDGSIYYIERSWDDDNKVVKSEVKVLAQGEYDELTSSDGEKTIGAGFHVVKGNISVDGGINVSIDELDNTSHLILCDGAKLTTPYVTVKNSEAYGKFHIYGQMGDTGEITNSYHSADGYPGVGSMGYRCTINIHGGKFKLDGGSNAAAIGGGENSCGGTLNIYGGEIDADGGSNSAGIGGSNGTFCNDINIYGGRMYSYSGPDGAGIGGGYNGYGSGIITIYGGLIWAGGSDGAGIGGGDSAPGGTIIINGGDIYATGCPTYDSSTFPVTDENGAGIGGGVEGATGDITINGGHVQAFGGTKGAGIGSGEDCDSGSGTITINGGYVEAHGGDEGAGIGGGQNASGCTVVLNGGTVIAKAGEDATGYRAIGPGYGNSNYGSLTFDPGMMVCSVDGTEIHLANYRLDYCWYRTQARIEPCTHQGASYHDNGHSVHVDCTHCYMNDFPYTFNVNGSWNDGNNWFEGLKPHNGNDVVVKAQATIPADYCANVGDITIDGGTITIAEGGQLIHKNNGVTATVQKNISQYTVDSGAGITDGWYFITSPVTTSYTPDVTMLSNDFDLYRLNNTIWENWKQTGDHNHFNLENSRGYLYANSEDVTLEFTGTVLPSANSKNVSVDAGFNLIGNPLLHNVYADRVYYKMNDERTGIIAVENYQEKPITPCTGIIVNADASGTVTFTKEAPALANDNGSMQITLSKVKNERASTGSATVIDNAIVSFNAGTTLPKLRFSDNAEIYIPQEGDDYAIAYSDRTGEMPLHFKAQETGQYTVSFECDDLNGIKLIDKFENVTIDLGIENSYTFTASAADSRDRFVLVFSSTGIETGSEAEVFAYQSGSDIIVTGEGELQVFDMMGRMIYTRYLNGVGTHRVCPSQYGVYILKLNEKTQKIVIQ